MTLQAVKNKRITLDTLFTVSARAASQAPSKIGFKPGTQITVDNALKILMVKSANDMAVVLAEGVSGSVEKFSAEMNCTSKNLGMTQSSWVNPNGLPADEQISSARDLAILARALIHDFPEYDMYWHIPAIQLGKKTMRNFNTLIGRYEGADGMKTGFICASGFNLVATASRNGKRLIAVVLGAPSSPYRAAKAAGLLERGFHRGPLSWLSPSLGSVESLQPINAAPPDLRDEMCGAAPQAPGRRGRRRRKRVVGLHAVEPAAERRQGLGAAQGPARRRQGDRGVHRRGQERRRGTVRQRPRQDPEARQGQEGRRQAAAAAAPRATGHRRHGTPRRRCRPFPRRRPAPSRRRRASRSARRARCRPRPTSAIRRR